MSSVSYIVDSGIARIQEYTELLVQHAAIKETGKEYIKKLQYAIQLEEHVSITKSITNKYTMI